MTSSLFTGLFETEASLFLPDFLYCLIAALFAGLILALFYRGSNRSSGSFIVTLALLPSVVCVIILIVNGSIGTAVAVAGAFSLVRFRSAAGSAKEICAIFLAMGAGLLCGAGYLAYALLFTLLLCLVWTLYLKLDLCGEKKAACRKILRITVPETLDYPNIFTDLFETYTSEARLMTVKTCDLGSLFRLSYEVTLKDEKQAKEMIDALRCRNGNLEISLSEAVRDEASEL